MRKNYDEEKLLTITTLLAASVALTSCTAEAVAVTGLVLASVAVGALAYEWMENPDAYNAYAKVEILSFWLFKKY